MSTMLVAAWIPLQEAVVCLNDETVFSVRNRYCPTCATNTFASLARFLEGTNQREFAPLEAEARSRRRAPDA